MFTINDDNSIYATRGDIVFFSVSAEDDGVPFKFQAGDVLRIKVYGKKDAENVVLQKDFPVTEECEAVEIFLTEEDTKLGEVISKPKDYWYEVELNPHSNPQTIIGYDEDGAKVFKLFPEGDDIPEFVPDPEDIRVMDDELDMTSDRPVQNQAISRAVVSLRADFEETKEDITAKSNSTAEAVEEVATEVATERARIDNLLSGATADNSEVADVRVGADGITYDSAGTAVRRQFSNALIGVGHVFNYKIFENSTYPLDMTIKKNTRYRVVIYPGENVANIDIGYTNSSGTDILLVDNAVSGQEYEFTIPESGTRFRFWTYLDSAEETTVTGYLTELGLVDRSASTEHRMTEVEAALYGYKARVTKDDFSIAQGFVLEQFYKIKPGKKFYISFDSFNYDAIEKLNLYCYNSDGNEIFHDALVPVIGELYECYTDKENAVLNIYIYPTEAGGAVDFTMSIHEEDGTGKRITVNEKAISNLKETQEKVGIPFYEDHSKNFTVTDAWDIEYPTKDDAQYVFKAEGYTGQYLSELQLYAFNSLSDYITIQKGVQIGDTITFSGNSAYQYFRVYAVLSSTEEAAGTLSVKLAEYNANSLIVRVEALEEAAKAVATSPNVLILGDSYAQMGYWVNELRNLVSLGEVVNLGVSSATLKDRYTDRTTYPYDSRPVSNDTRGGNVNTFGSQVEKLKRLMKGEDLDSGETQVFADSTPDIILIEGGTNDAVDAATDGYVSQIYTIEKAYIKRRSDGEGYMGYIKKPTNYEDTDRTTFGGAMRYLYGVLQEMFPNALIFFVTPCGLTYMSGGEHKYLEKGEQIKYAASLLGIPVIDWGVNGRLSLCDNVVTGSGTEDDPYIYDAAGEYSLDALHPNTKGAHFLAMEVAKVLRDYNLVVYHK